MRLSLRCWFIAPLALVLACCVPADLGWSCEPTTVSKPADNPDKDDQVDEGFPVDQVRRRAVFTALGQQEAGLNPQQVMRVADNCLWGMPKKKSTVDHGPTKYVFRDGYVLEHSSTARIPLWVAEHCTKPEISSQLRRTNPFRADPELSPMERAEKSDYRGSGFDRGHMAPNGNQTLDDRLRRETFFLSNIVPQVGRKFNQHIWADLEEHVRDWTRSRGESWIITGPLFFDPEEENPATADGYIEVTVIGDNQVEVPTHLFKIIVAKDPQAHEWKSIAFVMKNADHPDDYEFATYIQSIDWIEERAGFDFMPDIQTESGDPMLEAKLESQKSSLWED